MLRDDYFGASLYEGGWQSNPTMSEVFDTVMPGWQPPDVIMNPPLVFTQSREEAVALANGVSAAPKRGGNVLMWGALALIIGGVLLYGFKR